MTKAKTNAAKRKAVAGKPATGARKPSTRSGADGKRAGGRVRAKPGADPAPAEPQGSEGLAQPHAEPGSGQGETGGEAQAAHGGRKGRKHRGGREANPARNGQDDSSPLTVREAKGTEADAEDWLPPDALARLQAKRALTAAIDAAEMDHARRGRPSKDTPKRRERILARLADGDFLTVICREERLADPDFPATRTVDEWAEGDASFSAAIARAREAGALKHLAAGMEIVDSGFTDYLHTPFGLQFNRASVARSKLQADYRIMLAEKLAPRTLGKKVELSSDPERPFGGPSKPLSDYSEAELLAAFEEAQARRGQ